MGCQKTIAVIVGQESDYAQQVKNNQPALAAATEEVFDAAEQAGYQAVSLARAEWAEKDHGRIERRRCAVIGDPSRVRRRLQGWTGTGP